jgi:hypothetical protein
VIAKFRITFVKELSFRSAALSREEFAVSFASSQEIPRRKNRLGNDKGFMVVPQ